MTTTPTSSRDSPLILEEFSRDYLLLHGVDVFHCSSCATAEMDWALLEALEDALGASIIGKIGNTHWEFEASHSVPSQTVAIPDSGADDNQLLLLK